MAKLSATGDPHVVKECEEAFAIFDKDGDGSVTVKELGNVMRSLGQNPTEEELVSMMEEVCAAHPDHADVAHRTMTYRDFEAFLARKIKETTVEEEMKVALGAFDEKKNGTVNVTHLKLILMSWGDRLSAAEVEDLMKDAEVDDGYIVIDDFVKGIMSTTKDHE
jgi:calmodulin